MKTLATLALAAALPIAGALFPPAAAPPVLVADDETPRPGRRAGLLERLGDGLRGRLAEGLDELDVSEAQRDAMAAIVSQHADRLRALRETETAARVALLDASATRPTDAGAIVAASHALAAAMAETRIATGTMRDELRGVLSPEQVAELDTMRAEGRERLGELRSTIRERLSARLAERRGR